MVKIRLARGGAKKKPFYSIVVTDSRKPRDSGYIERIGYFNPIAKGQETRLELKLERLAHWASKGAQTSERVKQLVKEYGDPSIREKRIAEQEAKAAAEAEVKAKEAAEVKAKEEAEVKAKEEQEAKAAAEVKAKEEAKAKEEQEAKVDNEPSAE